MSFNVTPIVDYNTQFIRWMMNEERSTRNEKGGEPGLLASRSFPLRGIPISLTEGGLPVVCWPAPLNQKMGKLLRESVRKGKNHYGIFITFD
jgi:hypothetical protein